MKAQVKALSVILLGLSGLVWQSSAFADDDLPLNFAQNQVSLLDAIATAKGQVPGVAKKVDYENRMSGNFYEVELVTPDGNETEVVVDTKNGAVVNVRAKRTDNDDHRENQYWLQALQSGSLLTLENAVQLAEQQFQAKAYGAEMDDNRGMVSYKVEMMTANGMQVKTRVPGQNMAPLPTSAAPAPAAQAATPAAQ